MIIFLRFCRKYEPSFSKERMRLLLRASTLSIMFCFVSSAAIIKANNFRGQGIGNEIATGLAEGPVTLSLVKGRVTGLNGEALPGVNILIKGTNIGTNTDQNGYFVIEIPENDNVLVFSFIGFKTVELAITTQTDINVTLLEDVMALAEVEVRSTGYWTETKERSTGNIEKVVAKDIERQPVTSPLMALQGRVAGLEISPGNGVPGNAPKIRIRGENSLRFDGGLPLYVIDGVVVDSRPLESGSKNLINAFDPLSTINPANIESIEVLKDADATSIYGSRGANGVILITTKTGKNTGGKTEIDLSLYSGVGEVANNLQLLTTPEYIEMRREAFVNDGMTPTPGDARDLLLWDTTRYTNWQEELLGGTARINDIQANLSGGNATTSFRLGGGMHKETMVFPGNFYYSRASASVNLNHSSRDLKFRTQFTANYGSDKNRLFSDDNFVMAALNLPPNAPSVYNPDGSLNWAPDENNFRTWDNPLAALQKTHDSRTNNLVANATFSYEIIKGLSLKTSIGFTDLSSAELLKFPFSSMAPEEVKMSTARNRFGYNDRQSWILEPQATYTGVHGKHDLNAVIGTTWQESESEYRSILASGYTSDALLGALQWATTTQVQAEGLNQYKYNAIFARFRYLYKERYLINITGRRDGSSRFGPGNRFGNFGAIGAAWIFSKEKFIVDNLKFLSFGKLRMSYGTTGNDQIGDYQFYDYYEKVFLTYDSKVGINPTALFNPQFKWEATKKMEVGLELSLFANRLSVEASIYDNRSSNQLINYQLPSSTGFDYVLSNFNATVRNSGLEILVNSRNVDGESFVWSTSLNFTIPKNKLLEFPGIETSSYATTYKVGDPLSVQRVQTFRGVDPASGAYLFEDFNDDQTIDDLDLKLAKPLTRRYYGGLTNTFSFGAFEASFLVQFSRQNAFKYSALSAPGQLGNQPDYVLFRWTSEGDQTDIQRFNQDYSLYSNYVNHQRSDRMTVDGTFFRLKTMSLSYSVPLKPLGDPILKSLRVFVQGQNLFTYADWLTYDPETGASLPPLRIITIGASLKI